MTQAEAYRVLGISSSTRRPNAQLLYQEKCKKLRLQMVPGMPVAIRQKAQAELARVDTAWQIVQAARPTRPTSAKPVTAKPATRKKARPSPPNVIPYRKPQTLAEAWEQVVLLSPFSEAVTAVIMIAVFLLTIISLLKNF